MYTKIVFNNVFRYTVQQSTKTVAYSNCLTVNI